MKILTLLFLLGGQFWATHSAFAQHGGNVGGGDGECENKIHSVRHEIHHWVTTSKIEGLELPPGISLSDYVTRMSDITADEQVVVACHHRTPEVPFPIMIGNVPKTCKNTQGNALLGIKPIIDCDFEGVMASSSPGLFRTVHHEFANLKEIEKYGEEISDYSVSDQINEYGGWVSVYRLGPHKKAFDATAIREVDPNITCQWCIDFPKAVMNRANEISAGINTMAPGARVRGYIGVKGALYHGNEDKKDIDAELRNAGISWVPFEIEALSDGTKLISVALMRDENISHHEDGMGIFKELSAFVFTYDNRNPKAVKSTITFGVKLGLPIVVGNHGQDFVGPALNLDVGSANITYNVENLYLGPDLSQVKQLIHDSTGVYMNTILGLSFQKVLPKNVVLSGLVGYHYERTGTPNGDEQNADQEAYNARPLTNFGIQSVSTSGYAKVELDHQVGKRNHLALFYEGNFFQKLTAQGNFLNRTFDMTPLVPVIPQQIGIKFKF